MCIRDSLKLAAQELSQVNFEAKAKELEGVESGLFVPSQGALSMFDPATWTKCFAQFWFGDALPNMDRPRRITFEQIFLCLLDRDELEYSLDRVEETYVVVSILSPYWEILQRTTQGPRCRFRILKFIIFFCSRFSSMTRP